MIADGISPFRHRALERRFVGGQVFQKIAGSLCAISCAFNGSLVA